MRVLWLLFGIALICAGQGCANSQHEMSWIQHQGGLVQGPCLAKAQRAEARLGTDLTALNVLDDPAPGAYSWPDGNVFVTKGLVDLLTEQELAAAIAHEMGHLLNDGHLQAPVSLQGCCTTPNIEERADAIGVRLLQQAGISRDVMPQMLEKVERASSTSAGCRSNMQKRIDLLRSPSRSADLKIALATPHPSADPMAAFR